MYILAHAYEDESQTSVEQTQLSSFFRAQNLKAINLDHVDSVYIVPP